MIPASYLFKNVYQKEWLEAEQEPPPVAAESAPRNGHPIFMRLLGLLMPRPQPAYRRTAFTPASFASDNL